MSTATYKNAINDVVGQIKVIHKKAESIKKSLGECLAYWDVIDNAIDLVSMHGLFGCSVDYLLGLSNERTYSTR